MTATHALRKLGGVEREIICLGKLRERYVSYFLWADSADLALLRGLIGDDDPQAEFGSR